MSRTELQHTIENSYNKKKNCNRSDSMGERERKIESVCQPPLFLVHNSRAFFANPAFSACLYLCFYYAANFVQCILKTFLCLFLIWVVVEYTKTAIVAHFFRVFIFTAKTTICNNEKISILQREREREKWHNKRLTLIELLTAAILHRCTLHCVALYVQRNEV